MTFQTRLRMSACVVGAWSLMIASQAKAAPPVAAVASHLVGQDGTGTIKGKLVYGGDEAPEAKVVMAKGQADKDPAVCASKEAIVREHLVVDSKTKGVKNGIVYLVSPQGDHSDAVKALLKKHPKVESDQKNCVYVPHVLAMHKDQELLLKSSDPVSHNVHLTGFVNGFNIVIPPMGQLSQPVQAEKRPNKLTCDIHPWMKSWVMVLDHPFFAVTGDDGTFEIEGVPAGTQNLVLWQESVGYATQGFAKGMKIEVKSGEATDVGSIKIDPKKVKED